MMDWIRYCVWATADQLGGDNRHGVSGTATTVNAVPRPAHAAVDPLDLVAQVVLVHPGQLLVLEQHVAADQHRVLVARFGHRVRPGAAVEVRCRR